ncbi:MAG: ergothioneine biosynthesis protein EgtB [Planctomycetaceae bacterium]|nr:ergothioneine biosynthesis protein EgtB [Planctomycetaceae bacterium]
MANADLQEATISPAHRKRYTRIRHFSEQLCDTLTPEDCCLQTMPDVSPLRWHLAHTTWFFETFLLKSIPDYHPVNTQYEYLFNSYYNSVGHQFPRPHRGTQSRPSFAEIMEYRRLIDERVLEALQSEKLNSKQQSVLELGLHHEQQHQELMLTDIKHVFASNPTLPVYRDDIWSSSSQELNLDRWTTFPEGLVEIGHDGSDFAYDNESPRHRVFLEQFALRHSPITNGEYLQFIEAGGYRQPEHWLSLGWQTVQEEQWEAPLYWKHQESEWHEFTLGGLKPLDLNRPVTHVSYFEADAFCRWAGYRLPTEAEWEFATESIPSMEGHFADTLIAKEIVLHPQAVETTEELSQMFGNVWEWTASPYTAYPGYQPAAGALGEYNGKFMCNQYVLRGGSVATSADHIRSTYRNFFPPAARWQFMGFRPTR